MSDHIRILITDSQNTGRIDKVISKEDVSLTRSRVQNLISAGSVTVNSLPIHDKNYRVNVNTATQFCKKYGTNFGGYCIELEKFKEILQTKGMQIFN